MKGRCVFDAQATLSGRSGRPLGFLGRTAHLLVFTGLWGDAGVPCVTRTAADPTDAVARAQLCAQAQVLTLLREVTGVPHLLHLDPAASVLVQERPEGLLLSEAQAVLPREVARWCGVELALASILEWVHRAGVLLGDLHPDNVVLDPASGRVALLDLGAAVVQGHVDAGFRHAAQLGRALPFGEPELTGRMARAADFRADHYALGAVLYALLCAHPPFVEDDPLALLHALLTCMPPAPRVLAGDVPVCLFPGGPGGLCEHRVPAVPARPALWRAGWPACGAGRVPLW